MKISKETIARTAVLFITLVNQILTMVGKNPLPVSETTAYNYISAFVAAAAAIWAWWKNNSFTKAALKGDAVMKAEKEASKHGK